MNRKYDQLAALVVNPFVVWVGALLDMTTMEQLMQSYD